MSVIELSANLQGTSQASAESRLSMQLSATLYGTASSMQPKKPETPEKKLKG